MFVEETLFITQHAIEYLVEDTVRLTDRSDLADTTKRDYLAAIYRVQARYDTSYTHFRVISFTHPVLINEIMLEAEKKNKKKCSACE